MSKWIAIVQQLFTDESGATGGEYAICLGLIVIVVVVALLGSSGGLSDTVRSLSESFFPGARCSDDGSIVSLQVSPN